MKHRSRIESLRCSSDSSERHKFCGATVRFLVYEAICAYAQLIQITSTINDQSATSYFLNKRINCFSCVKIYNARGIFIIFTTFNYFPIVRCVAILFLTTIDLTLRVPNDDARFESKNRNNAFRVRPRVPSALTRAQYHPNIIPATWLTTAVELVPPERRYGYFSRVRRAHFDRAPAVSANRAIISIRGITDVSPVPHGLDIEEVGSTRGCSWPPKKRRKTSCPVITVAPVLSARYKRALTRCINLIRFSG